MLNSRAAVYDRREERAERRTEHIAELRKRAAEAEARLKRLYDAIENGIADLSDPMLKDRVAELKAIRDQARADAERAQEAIERIDPSITRQSLKTFARQARKRMRTESGGYRRDHLRALAQRVEVDEKEIRIMGSKSELLRTLVAASSAKKAGFGVHFGGMQPIFGQKQVVVASGGTWLFWYVSPSLYNSVQANYLNDSRFSALLQDGRELRTATGTSGIQNGGRVANLAIFAGIWTHSSRRSLVNA